MKAISRLALGLIGLAAVLAAGARGATDDKSVSETDKLQFTQKQVQALMQELQERMFRLADLTKQAEPDNSTRLLLALRKAREQLIVEEMKEILETLSKRDLTKATGDTKEVLVKLDELKKLLIATDLELQLQLERLRQLQAAIRQLDQAIKVEKQQKGESARLAELMKKGSEVKPQSLDKAKQDEAANRKRTDGVAGAVKALGGLDPAVQSLTSSGQSMSGAEGSLGSGKPGDAEMRQSDAVKKLAEARALLEKERQKVLQELEQQVKRVVIDNLQEMLDRQTAIRRTTERLSPKLAKAREALIQLQQLAPAEQRVAAICQQTLELVTETEFSVALPPALESLEKNMLLVSGNLAGGRGDERIIETEVAIEQDLKDLLETFKEMPTFAGQCDSQCSGCKGNMNKLLAELKVVRMMQSRVNKGTVDANGEARRAAAVAELPSELREKIGKLRDGEETTRDAVDRLHQRFAE
ncbi:MAG TPA: hypothetical protein VGY55_19700 [Pirellulales bacterium]|jgi:hypothetical protein|nr:hypothetical protein [Pirellulales bacterium]